MKHTLLSIAALLISFTALLAETVKLEALQVGRYTRQGEDGVLVESGFLSVATKKFESSGAALYPEESLGLPASSLTAINGKFVTFKATIDTYRQTIGEEFISNYTFSKAYYPVVGGDAYIVDFASGKDTTAPAATFKVSKSKLKEGPKSKSKIQVKLDKPSPSDIVVRYKITGNAKYSSDYRMSGTKGLVKIKKGKKCGSVTISLLDDKLPEKTE